MRKRTISMRAPAAAAALVAAAIGLAAGPVAAQTVELKLADIEKLFGRR